MIAERCDGAIPGHSRGIFPYLRFPFNPEERAAFCNGGGSASIVIDHPSYQAATTLSAETGASLVEDFA